MAERSCIADMDYRQTIRDEASGQGLDPTHHDMIQHTRTNFPNEQQAESDPFICEDDAEWLLRTRYGIPVWGTQWLLFSASYRPAPARYRGPAVGTERVPDGWVEAEVLSAARGFLAECKSEPRNLWTHPDCGRRFRLRPDGIEGAALRREVV